MAIAYTLFALVVPRRRSTHHPKTGGAATFHAPSSKKAETLKKFEQVAQANRKKAAAKREL